MTIATFHEKFAKGASYALICHIRPDGDALGCASALKRALEKQGKRADIFCDSVIPDKFMHLSGMSSVKRDINDKYDCYVALDCADLARLGKFAEIFRGNTFNLDHHVGNTRFAGVNCVIDAAANCQNVMALIKEMGVEIDREIAESLLTGISTDTGNFAHRNTQAASFIAAAELVEKGADVSDINYRMYRNQTKQRAELFGMVMSKIRYFAHDRIGVVTIMRADLEKTGAPSDATEGFIDFLMGVDCVEIGLCVLETADKTFKVSLRSKGADVNAVAATFGGGGHTLASGCMICGYYEDAVDRLVSAAAKYLAEK